MWPKSDRDIRLVKFGQGRDVLYYAGGATTSGYGSPERPHAAEGKQIPDGTPALDLRPAVETEAGFVWAYRGPMVDVDLGAGEVDAVNPDPGFAAMLASASPVNASNLALHVVSRAKGERAGPLDYVSIPEFIEGWRRVGARVGVYQGGVIEWDDTPAGWSHV